MLAKLTASLSILCRLIFWDNCHDCDHLAGRPLATLMMIMTKRWKWMGSLGNMDKSLLFFLPLAAHSWRAQDFYIKRLFFQRFYLFIFREGKGGRKGGRETSVCVCLCCSPYWEPGLQPRHVPTGKRTGNPLVHRPAFNPLSHTSQGLWVLSIKKFKYFKVFVVNLPTDLC